MREGFRKHKIRARVLLFVLLSCLIVLGGMSALPVCAAPPLLVDEADVLTPGQERELTEALEEISARYDIDVAVYTVESLDGKEALDYADDIYVYNGYGTGDEFSGILLLHKPSRIVGETEFAITCDGRVRETISTSQLDEMLDHMADAIVDGRDSGNYLPAYLKYIEYVDHDMKRPVERMADGLLNRMLGNALLAPIAGFILSFLYMGSQKAKLKSVHRQRGAANYMTGGPRLAVSTDQLVNRNVSRVPRRTESNSRGSSSGTGRPASVHTHSSGRTLSGGSRRV